MNVPPKSNAGEDEVPKHAIGDKVQMGNAPKIPMRNQFVTIRRIDTQQPETRYFVQSDSGKDGWVTQSQIDGGLPLDHLITLKVAATHVGVSVVGLRGAIHEGRVQATKVGKDWHITLAEAHRYKQSHRAKRKRADAV